MKNKYLLIFIPIVVIAIVASVKIFAKEKSQLIPVQIKINVFAGTDDIVRTKNGDAIGKLKDKAIVYDLKGNKIGDVILYNNQEPTMTGD